MRRWLQKRYILPIKWWWQKHRLEAGYDVKNKKEILEKKVELENSKTLFLRQRRTKEAEAAKNQLEFINWLLCLEEKD